MDFKTGLQWDGQGYKYRWISPLKYSTERSIVSRAALVTRSPILSTPGKKSRYRNKHGSTEITIPNVILKTGNRVKDEAEVIKHLQKGEGCKNIVKLHEEIGASEENKNMVIVLYPVGKSLWDIKAGLKKTFNLFVGA